MDKLTVTNADAIEKHSKNNSLLSESLEKLLESRRLFLEKKELEQINYLKSLGLHPDDLSNSGKQNLTVLAEIASLLDLADTKTSSFKSALTEMELEDLDDLEDEKSIQSFSLKCEKLCSEILEKSKHVISNIPTTSDSTNDLRMKEEFEQATDSLLIKSEEYESLLKNNEGSGNELQSDLNEIKAAVTEANSLKIQLNNHEAKIMVLRGIPADSSLARVYLDRAKADLIKLKAKRESLLRGLASQDFLDY